MTDYTWRPIEPLSEEDRNIDIASMRSLYDSWRAFKSRLQESSESSFRDFNQRLIRRLSVETGILERLYDLDRGTTEALVKNGFVEDIISHSSTDIEPSRLIDILRDYEQQNLTSAVIAGLAGKFGKRRLARFAELREVNTVALALRLNARSLLYEAFNQLKEAISEVEEPDIFIAEGGQDKGNAHWYKYEVAASAKDIGKFANFSEDHYFVKATIRANRERLVFVTSFHHIGRELSGIMEATAFATLESFEDSDDRQSVKENFFVCSLEPFVFTNKTNAAEVTDAFAHWIDRALAVAVKEYGDRL